MEKFDRLFKYSRTQGCKKRVASIQGSIRPITIFIFAKARRDTTGSSSVSGTRFQRFHRNSRSVFLPSGSWQNFHDGSKEKRSAGNGGEKEMDDRCRVFLLGEFTCDEV